MMTQPQTEIREIELKLNEQDANLIMGALMELPAKVSMNLIIKVRKQLIEQLSVPAQAPVGVGAQAEEE
jgi:hypothetical protein